MSVSDATRIERRKAAAPLLGTSWLRPERIARLRSAFERLAAGCAEGLVQLSPSPVRLGVRELSSGKAGEFLSSLDAAGVVGVFRNAELGPPVLIGSDGGGIDSLIEAAFGADGSEPAGVRTRPLSTIELRLAGAVFRQIAWAVQDQCAGSDPVPLNLDRIECLGSQPALARRDDDWLIARLDLAVLDRTGEIFILLPQPVVQGFQDNPSDVGPAVPAVRDPRWSTRIQRELTRTHVTLQAVLDERDLTLGEVAGLRVGQVLPLRATPQSPVRLVCNEQTLFWCELGQAEGRYTLRMHDFADEEQELIDAILSH